ncbi:MAG TPA: hypothetical protein VFS44_11925 [Gemmatimonadaceae bacterium]|nr:hypothetical protein [Gemmatimonadaceae bacterium]
MPTRLLPLAAMIVLLASCRRADRAGDRGAAVSVTRADSCAARDPAVTAAGVGQARLHARIATLPRGCVARDSAWSSEGSPERGTIVRVGAHEVLAVTTGTRDSSIQRVVVTDPALRAPGDAGVGSTVDALRRGHAPLCALAGEGRVALVAGDLPGLSFITDAAPAALPRGATPARAAAELPGRTLVTTVLVTGVAPACTD